MHVTHYQEAVTLIRRGIAEANGFSEALDRSVRHALEAGWAFARARALHDHGTWGPFLAEHLPEVNPKTVRRYIQFTCMAMARVAEERPDLLEGRRLLPVRNPDKTHEVSPTEAARFPKLFELCQQVALESPVEFTALCREVGLLRKFTEAPGRKRADEARRSENRVKGWVDFATTFSAIRGLARIDELPEAKLPPRADLERVAGELETALGKVRAILDRDASTIEA